MKVQVLQLVMDFLKEVKDPRALMFRVVTLLVGVLLYTLVENPQVFTELAQNISRESVLEAMAEEREKQFPKLAKERVSMIYGQTRADLVYVVHYVPKNINNFGKVVVYEGLLGSQAASLMETAEVVDKTSKTYLTHLTGQHFSLDIANKHTLGDNIFVHPTFKLVDLRVTYMYTCPIFSIDNVLTGFIGIGWKEKPEINIKDDITLESYLFTVCDPHARSLGRNI